MRRTAALAVGLPLLLAACATVPRHAPPAPRGQPTVLPAHPPDIGLIPNAVPRWEPRSSLGNPPFYDVDGHRYFVRASASGYVERGVASWYGPQFNGLRTATGEPYDMFAMTAAHKTLPLPCFARVTNLQNGRSVVVRINDRGPFVANRIIDLSYSAAAKLGMLRTGTAFVQVQTITPPPPEPLTVSLPATTPAAAAAASGVSSVPALSAAETRALPSAPDTAGAAPGEASADPGGARHALLYIQVGAFAQEGHARRAAQRLRAAGVPGVFTLGPEPHHRLLRVRVGPIRTVQQFDSLMNRLRSLGFQGALAAPQ